MKNLENIKTICPKGYSNNGKTENDLYQCINKCPNKCLPEPLLYLIYENKKSDYHKNDYISASALQGCLRQTYLERTNDVPIVPKEKQWSMLRGSLIHATLSQLKISKYFTEKTFRCKILDKWRYGTVDMYDKKNKILIDFKTQKDKANFFILQNKCAKDDHILQTNIYRYFMKYGECLDKRVKTPIDVNKIQIIYLSMTDVITTGTSYFKNKKYYDIDDVKILDDDYILSYLKDKCHHIDNAFENNILPPIPDEQTRGWLCGESYKNLNGYCTVKQLCPYWLKLKGIENETISK